MPRPRLNPLFEIGEYWVGRDYNSPLLYRYWWDKEKSRTRRATLGTADLEEAKLRLADLVINTAPVTQESRLSTVFERYCDEHGDKTETGSTARIAYRLFKECWGVQMPVSDVSEARQKEFAQWCASERGFALGTISRHLEILRAALRYSDLSTKVYTNKSTIRDKWRVKTKPPRKVYIPTDAELKRLWNTDMPENLRRWILISMGTGGRPAAALDLSPASRRREAGLLDLLPADRVQNKKYRPVVKVPPILARAMDRWEKEGPPNVGGAFVGYTDYHGVKQALERVCAPEKANIPNLTTYSFRHKVATVLRLAKVPSEQISAQLGHRRPEDRITASYGSYDPDYLKESAAALEAWINAIVGKKRKR